MDKRFKGTEEEYVEFRRKRNEANKKYYSKPEVRERKRIYAERYRVENKEKISKYGKELRARPEYKERIKKWGELNKEHIRKYRQTSKYRARKKLHDKKYSKKNKERINKNHRKWRKKNLGKIKKYNQKYYHSPKGIVNYTHHNHRRISLIKERPFDLSSEKIKQIFERDKVCVYCGGDRKLELDHIIPLKLGGNSLFNNFVLACEKCNRSKSGRDVFYWCKLQGIKVPEIVLELLDKQKTN